MKRRTLLIGGAAAASAAGAAWLSDPLRSRPDPTETLPAVGILTGGFNEAYIEAFRQGLRDHGWIPGQNIAIVLRDVGSDIQLLPAAANELASLGVRVIVATGPAPASAAMTVHPCVAVVMAGNFDPINAGVISSFAAPGGNVTGVVGSVGLDSKRVEFLKQLVPASERLAFITNLGIASQEARVRTIEESAEALGMRVRVFDVRSASQIEPAFDAVRDWDPHVLMPNSSNPMANARAQVVGLVARLRLAAMYGNLDWVRAGGLVGLGPELGAIYRRAATYVDKILRGAAAAQLPVERSSVFEMVVNRTTLSELGLSLPPSLAPLVTAWVD